MKHIFNRDFLDFLSAMNNARVEYLIAGGYSVIVHGYNRTTGDLDVWVNKTKKNYNKIEKAFHEFEMPLFDMTPANFMNSSMFDVFTFGRPPLAIDLMTAIKGLNFDECYRNRIIKEINNIQVNFLSLSDLRKAKTASARPKDLDDLEHLPEELE